MSTLVIPDIHLKWPIVQSVIDRHPEVELRVFLGDIYDDFGDTLEQVKQTAIWHKAKLGDPKNLFLFGNHDLPYAFPESTFLQCSGNTPNKSRVINGILTREEWNQTELYCEIKGWTLSHAGIHQEYEMLMYECQKALDDVAAGKRNKLVGAGYVRGGHQSIGGITWLDWDMEFSPVKGLKQIVGHTPHNTPQQKGDNWDMDTHLRHYGIIDDEGVFEVREV